jgi:diguanylate cyclase (GGDEF)-like protein
VSDEVELGTMNDRAPDSDSVVDRLGHAFRFISVAMGLLIIVIAALLIYVVGSLRPDDVRYAEGDRAVQQAHQAMTDQETGLRAYLILHDSVFLQPYQQGVDALAAANDTVTRRVGSVSAAAPLVLEMRVTQQAWISQWAIVVVNNQSPTNPDDLRAFLVQGKNLFDQYRVSEQRLDSLLDGRRESVQTREGQVLALGLGTILLVALGLVAVMERQRRSLRKMLVAPVDDIVAATERIAGGDLGARVDTTGPTEFRRIAASVNTMGEALVRAREEAASRSDLVEQQAEQLRRILTMAREIAGTLSIPYVLRSIASSALQISGFDRVIVWMSDVDNPQTMSAVVDTAVEDDPDRELRHAEIGIGLVGHAVKYGRTAAEVGEDEPSVEVHPERPLRNIAVPLIVGARVTGAVEFSGVEPTILSAGTLEVLETLAIHAAAAIEAARLHVRTEEMGNTDALTSLANRRSFDADLAAECERSARYERPLALIMFDVDHFKEFNDAFGHQRGDEVLQELADTVLHQLRGTDTAYRYGGEEFAVLARETTGPDAAVLAQRLRIHIQDHFAAHGSLSSVTASFGIALVPPEEAMPTRMVAVADAALYDAKAAGRNCVRSGPSTPV